MAEPLQIRPLTPHRWGDLEALFGPRGAVAGCWCMWWRQTAREFEQYAGEANRQALRSIVEEGQVPGLLAYRDGRTVGWVSVAPRKEFGRLDRSPTLGRVDETPVWSVACFYVVRD
ncbi:MAG: GNAT family N-acetyltransferase, partial [Actinomycetota bacterium]|nr:GNAT family N-acetyltransferase [Actinomycetota bacterium]